MNNIGHQLLQLSASITKFYKKSDVVQTFVDGANSIFNGNNFHWSEQITGELAFQLEVGSRKAKYGYIHSNTPWIHGADNLSLYEQYVLLLSSKLDSLANNYSPDTHRLKTSESTHRQVEVSQSSHEYQELKYTLNDSASFESENNLKYRLMVSNSPDVVVIQDKMGKIAFVSPRSESILGYEASFFLGKTPLVDLIHPRKTKLRIQECFQT